MKKNKCYDKMNLDGVTDGVTIKLAIFVLTVQEPCTHTTRFLYSQYKRNTYI